MKEEVFLFANYRHKTNHEVFVINQEIVVYKSQTLTNKTLYYHKSIIVFVLNIYIINYPILIFKVSITSEMKVTTSKQKATAILFSVRAVRSTVLY